MNNRFSADLKESISFSAEEAIRTDSPAIRAAHLLLGLIRQGHNAAVTLLAGDLGLPLPELKAAIEATLPPAGQQHRRPSRLPVDPEAERSIRGSVIEAKKTGSRTIGADHLLVSLFNDHENQLYLIFRRWGIDRLPYPGMESSK